MLELAGETPLHPPPPPPMSKFIKQSNSYAVAPGESLDVYDALPAQCYVLKFHPMRGYYLEMAEEFKLPPKVYGDTFKQAERILDTFRDRDRNTGVLLVGEKGSGKTLLAKTICSKSNLPVIIISTKYEGEDFFSFLTAITQPCIVMFDEFEKVYDRDHQESILTLLDGTYQSRKLFLLTSNDKWRLDANMKNRPGRIFYFLEFGGLSEEFIKQYCQENLKDQDKAKGIIKLSCLFETFNFDMLCAVVEETNRYGEEACELLTVLNTRPEYTSNTVYTVNLMAGDTIIPKANILGGGEITARPLEDDFEIEIRYFGDSSCTELMDIYGGSEFMNSDRLHSFLESGVLTPNSPPKAEGERSKFVSMRFDVIFEAGDLIKYENGGGLLFKNDEGFIVRLSRKTKPASKPLKF